MYRTFAAAIALLTGALAFADPRPWTFVEDTYPEGRGRLEYEQWVTYSAHSDPSASRYDFRHQWEYGLTDKLDVSLYLPDWHYEDSDARTGSHFDDVAAEAIYYFTNPHHDPVGIGLFAELGFGEHGMELTNKLIIHRDFGPRFSVAYNLIVATEFENAYNAEENESSESIGALGHALAGTFKVDAHWHLGGELLVETSLPHWSQTGDTTCYLGPNVSYVQHFHHSGSEFWFTSTPMVQLTDVEKEPDLLIRLMITWLF